MPRSRRLRVVALACLLVLVALPATAAASLNRWHPISALQVSDVHTIVTVPGSPGELYVGEQFAIHHSLDAGQTWVAENGPCFSVSLAVDPSNPQTAYAGCVTNGVYRSRDGGATWSQASSGLAQGPNLPSFIWGLAVDPHDSNTVFAVGQGSDNPVANVWRSRDGGDSWTPVETGPPGEDVSIDPQDSGHVVVSTDAGVIVSTDGGDTWSAPTGSGFPRAVVDPTDSNVLWAVHYRSAGAGVMRSTDDGATWSDLPGSPAGPRTITATGDALWVVGDQGVSRSLDDGATWVSSKLDNALNATPSALAVDAADAGHVFVGTEGAGGLWDVEFDQALHPDDWFQGMALAPTTDITATAATLNVTVSALFPGSTGACLLHWGVVDVTEHTASCGTLPAGPEDSTLSLPITGLAPETTYNVSVEGAIDMGPFDFTAFGPSPTTGTFTTAAIPAPPVPPTVSAPPTPHLLAGQLTTSRALPVSWAWTTADGSAAVAASDLQEQVAGAAWADVTPTSTAAFTAPTAFDGSAYRLRARAVDVNGLAGDWSAGPRVTAHLIDDRSAPLAWSSGWTRAGSASAAFGTLHATTVKNARVTLHFTGRSIAVLGPRGPGLAPLAASVDGQAQPAIDPAAGWKTARRTLVVWSWATSGPHTVTLTALPAAGRPQAVLDGFAVLSG